METLRIACIILSGTLAFFVNSRACAASVLLQMPTATFSQSNLGDFGIARTIDGVVNDNLGWAVQDPAGGVASQTAAYETANNIGYAGGSLLTFTMIQNGTWFNIVHTLGRFRLSVTTDDRSTFADGLRSGGDVTANWTVLQPFSYQSARGATLTRLSDDSILASGITAFSETYTLVAETTLTGITGIRLEMLNDPSLPNDGPGRAINGNFILSELQVSITQVPEPGAFTLLLVGAGLIGLRRRTMRA